MNLLGDRWWPGFDASIWWISLGTLPMGLSKSLLAVSAFALLGFTFRRSTRPRGKALTAALALTLAAAAAANVIMFYTWVATDRITAGFPIPFSLLICTGMLLVALAALRRQETAAQKSWRVLAVSHFYHLPRIKLSYQRAGFEVCDVPARQKYFLSQMPYSRKREVAAFRSHFVKQRPAPPAPTRA